MKPTRCHGVVVLAMITLLAMFMLPARSMQLEDLDTTYARLAARTSTETLTYSPTLKYPNGLTILYQGSRGSKIEPCGCRGLNLGGIDREAALINETRRANPATILLDSGGFFRSTLDAELRLQTHYFLQAAPVIGYNAMNIGYRDLSSGIDFLKSAQQQFNLPFISANIVDAQSAAPLFPTHRVLDVKLRSGQAIKVGVIGVTARNANQSHPSPLTTSTTQLDRWQLPIAQLGGGPSPVTPSGGGNTALQFALTTATATQRQYRIANEIESAKSVAEQIRESCDVLILLCFAGPERTRAIADAVPLFEVAISGDFLRRTESQFVGPIETITTGIDQDGKYLGQVEIELDAQRQVLNKSADLIPILVSYVTRPDITQFITAFNRDRQKLPAPRAIPINERPFVGYRQCSSCHAAQTAHWRTTAHATAMKSLVQKGMQENNDCVGCHTVGFREPGGFTHIRVTLDLVNVQCESCHGHGRKHVDEERARQKQPTQSPRVHKMKNEFDLTSCVHCHDQQNDPDFDFLRDLAKTKHTTTTATLSPR